MPSATAPLEKLLLDYATLHAAGIRLLERLASTQWTDFNTHDPGITILEQLCYAITDLGYRIQYDLKDVLATADSDPYRALYRPGEILTTHPVTLTDLRKLVIDIKGVRNAWIEPVATALPLLYYDASDDGLYLEAAPHRKAVSLQGIYRVLIDADGSISDLALIDHVQQRLQACRNLGQLFEAPVVLRRQPITVSAEIEVNTTSDPNRLLAQIYHALARFIAPQVPFYTLSDMLARGMALDQIMDGPALDHGFIDSAELEQFERKPGLRGSDLIREIMALPGVSSISGLMLSDGIVSDPWYLNLNIARNQNSIPVLDIETDRFGVPTITLRYNGVALHGQPVLIQGFFKELQQAETHPILPESERDLRLPPGRKRAIGHYDSIQHQFPAAYGIGEFGLPASASAQRQAQANQLKAYLLFFDQLLANDFAQLAQAQTLFAFDTPQPRSYFTQLIDDPKLGVDDIWRHTDSATRAANLESLVERPIIGAERKNRFLDHLLARFAEEFVDYSLHLSARATPTELIGAKSAFLRDYRRLGSARGQAFDLTHRTWGDEHVSGLEQRIGHKLGLASLSRQELADLADDSAGGFHLIEAILLRPQADDLAQWLQTSDAVGWQTPALLTLPQVDGQPPRRDPFSLRLCFVFPNWLNRFDRAFVRRLLREETPAHLAIQLHWLDRSEMRAFEAAYKIWLTSNEQVRVRVARDLLIDLLRIGNPMPLRDLPLSYPPKVAPRQAASIVIANAQPGVRYQLCDEDGNPVLVAGSLIEVAVSELQATESVTLRTPPINEDTTFSILAIRAADAYGTALDRPLETYLRATISIKVGIDTSLPVTPEPAAGQSSQGTQITVNYNDPAAIAISNSQEGISYVLVRVGEDQALSSPVQGNRATIVLLSPPQTEDSVLQVKAYRTQARSSTDRLTTTIAVYVRPNPAITITSDPGVPPVVAFNTAATFVIENAQASASYQLYRRQLDRVDYVTDATPGRLEVPGQALFIQAPAPTASGSDPAGFELVGSFAARGAVLSVSSGSLTEDCLFVVLATKTDNQARLQLNQALVALVAPDPTPQLGVVQTPLAAEAAGAVTVTGTQRGVHYQLLRDTDGSPINLPGYDYRDRGVGSSRIQVDFVVEAAADRVANQTLLLPTGPVDATSSYRVLATKLLSGVRVELNEKAKITVRKARS